MLHSVTEVGERNPLGGKPWQRDSFMGNNYQWSPDCSPQAAIGCYETINNTEF